MFRLKILFLIFLSLFFFGFAPGRKIGDDFLPPSGEVKLLILLVEFPQQEHKLSSEEIKEQIFADSQESGFTVYRYFQQASAGKLKISGDCYGWIKLSHPESYYANNSFGQDPLSFPRNIAGLVKETLEIAEQKGVDFSLYDNSGDGAVDGLVIIFAGAGGQSGGRKNFLWPWIGYLSMEGAEPFFADGVKIDRYALVNELNLKGKPAFARVLSHELGHLLGLPDLYDKSRASFGIGKFGLMGYGTYGGEKPYFPCAWSRVELGWDEVIEISRSQKLKLLPVEISHQAYKIPTFRAGEYFLLENRQPLAGEENLFGSGLVIYHIDERILEDNNQRCLGYCSEYHYLVSVEQADGLNQLETKKNTGDKGDFFPGRYKIRKFDDRSGRGKDLMLGAHSRLWDGELSGIRISQIREKKQTIKCRVKLNKPLPSDPFYPVLRVYEHYFLDLGDGDGLLEKGEKFKLILTISNQGTKARKIKINISAPELIPAEQKAELKGTLPPGQRRQLEFIFQMPANISKAEKQNITIQIQAKPGKKQEVFKIPVLLGVPKILLVNDDQMLGLKRYYQSALDLLQKQYFSLEIKDRLPGWEFFDQFELIIWQTGIRGADDGTSLDQKREELLLKLIQKDKKVILFSPALSLNQQNPLAEKLGIIQARTGTGIGGLVKKSPAGKIKLRRFYFPSLNPESSFLPAKNSQILFYDQSQRIVGIYQSQNQVILLGFGLELLPNKARAGFLKGLFKMLGE